jgi:hypothetical protein
MEAKIMADVNDKFLEKLLAKYFNPPELRGSQTDIEEIFEKERAKVAGFLSEKKKAEIFKRFQERLKQDQER